MQVEQILERLSQSRPQRARSEDAESRFCSRRIVIIIAGAGIGVGVSDGGVVDDGADIMSSRDMLERAHESREQSLALDVAVLQKWRRDVCDVVDYQQVTWAVACICEVVGFFWRGRYCFGRRSGCIQHFHFVFIFAITHSTSRCGNCLLSRCLFRRYLETLSKLCHTLCQTHEIERLHNPGPLQHSDRVISHISMIAIPSSLPHQTCHQAPMQSPHIERVRRIDNRRLRSLRSKQVSRDQRVREVFGAAFRFGADASYRAVVEATLEGVVYGRIADR